VTDLTLQTLIEFRVEVREFRDETRKGLAQHDHRLNLLTEQTRANTETLRTLSEQVHALIQQMRDQAVRLAQLETHMAALLATMPHVHTRIDDLAARVAALEAKLAASH
jgi:ABC-type transporter Mla subunit MlaD